MKQSYPRGFVADDMRLPLTFENYQGRLLVSDMRHVVMPDEKILCGKCRKQLFILGINQAECCGIKYTKYVHSYVIEASEESKG